MLFRCLFPKSPNLIGISVGNMKRLITEANISGKTLICVDIQPEYEKWFGFRTAKWIQFLTLSFPEVNNLVFLYNGKTTLDMSTEEQYKDWLAENGLEREIIDGSRFYDKGYAFFRSCMNVGIDEGDVVDFVKFMMRNNITDSRELDRKMWKEYIRGQKHLMDRQDLIELLQHSGEMIYIPDLMDFLKSYNNIVLTGGGLEQCLKEVEIALMALGKNYFILNEFTY